MRQLLAIRFKMLKHKYKQMRTHMNVLIVLLKVGKSVYVNALPGSKETIFYSTL